MKSERIPVCPELRGDLRADGYEIMPTELALQLPRLAWMHWYVPTIDTNDCVLYPGKPSAGGYGAVATGKAVPRGAHLISCEIAHGPRPEEGMEAAHSCGVRMCINPRHLRWATKVENQGDRVKHGTSNRGEQHGRSKLTWEKVREIRRRVAEGDMQIDMAIIYNVSKATISGIILGKQWIDLQSDSGGATVSE